MRQIVAYYRVSTKRQGESGLGLDAQQATVAAYCRENGCELLAEFTEIESGRVNSRPRLQMAMRLARARKATLVVAKLDRLARNVAFLSALMESRVDFVACDIPLANKLTLHILAAVAEHEVDRIRERTKVALQAAKARGQRLGSHRPGHWDGHEQQRIEGAKAGGRIAAELARDAAREAYLDVVPTIRTMHDQGHTLQAIADHLNQAGQTTRNGSRWRATTVQRTLTRCGVETHSYIPSPLTPR